MPGSMLSENFIKDPITGNGPPAAESQNHGAVHVEGKWEN